MAACFVFLPLLEKLTENESRAVVEEGTGKGKGVNKKERRERKTTDQKLSSTARIMCMVKQEKLSSTIMKNLNRLKVNDS